MERQLQRQLPRNVRQIGNVSDTPKIYVEDYVDTFFTQLCEKAQAEPVGAFLIGEMQETEEEEYVFIHGAVQMHELKRNDQELYIDEDTWKNGYEDCKQYFEDGEIVGWFVARPEDALTLDPGMLKIHRKSFEKKNSILVLKDALEREEVYYTYKFNDLMEIGGHYTYYEKNPSMQNLQQKTKWRVSLGNCGGSCCKRLSECGKGKRRAKGAAACGKNDVYCQCGSDSGHVDHGCDHGQQF